MVLAASPKAVGCPALSHHTEKSCQAAADTGAEKRKKVFERIEKRRLKNRTKKPTLSEFRRLHYTLSLLEKTSLKEFFITAVQRWFHY